MRPIIASVLLAVFAAPAVADDAHGKVVAFTDETIEIAVDEGHPREGAAVEVYIQLPDLEDTAWVCSGKVTRIEGDRVFVTITERSSDPREGDLAAIESRH